MKGKRVILLILSLFMPFVIAGRGNITTTHLNTVKEEAVKVLSQATTQGMTAQENPNTIFALAIDDYSTQFPNYLDITALNVTIKNAINLADYNADYVAPEFSDVLYDYQMKLVQSLSMTDRFNYESLRRQNYPFDRYATLNEEKYVNLNPTLKYSHSEIPSDPMMPITPKHPEFTPINSATTIQAGALAISGIITILTEAGLKDAAIAAFTACVSTMTTGLSTSWIPIVGWGLAVALVVGALIGLTVLIVENWPKIKSVIDDIKTWFLEEFSKFASYIESFFSDVIAKGNESLFSFKKEIGGKTFDFQEIQSIDASAQLSMAKKMRDNPDVLLISSVTNSAIQVALGMLVTEEFCIQYKTHLLGFSSYTSLENTARELILRAGTGYTSAKPELHLYNKNQIVSIGQSPFPHYAFKHFHNLTADHKRAKGAALAVHSFFGSLYYTPNNDGIGQIYQPIGGKI